MRERFHWDKVVQALVIISLAAIVACMMSTLHRFYCVRILCIITYRWRCEPVQGGWEEGAVGVKVGGGVALN